MPKLARNASKKAKQARIQEEMHKFKTGALHSGSKTGPTVENRKQAIAIALSEAGESRKPAKSGRKASRSSGRR